MPNELELESQMKFLLKLIFSAMLVASLFQVSACGKKGDLYLSSEPKEIPVSQQEKKSEKPNQIEQQEHKPNE